MTTIPFPEDRVLVGVIKRKKDLQYLLREHWYRIPRNRAPRTIEVEYLAFYLSTGLKEKNGGIHYFARRTGHELVRRIDLLPDEPKNARSNDVYYKLQLSDIQEKIPPILNPTARSVSFIYTTWDRFVNARSIADLYSKADLFVERVAHVLKTIGITAEQYWQDETTAQRISELQIHCQQGLLRVTADEVIDGSLTLLTGETDQEVYAGVSAIQAAIAELGGPIFVDILPES